MYQPSRWGYNPLTLCQQSTCHKVCLCTPLGVLTVTHNHTHRMNYRSTDSLDTYSTCTCRTWGYMCMTVSLTFRAGPAPSSHRSAFKGPLSIYRSFAHRCITYKNDVYRLTIKAQTSVKTNNLPYRCRSTRYVHPTAKDSANNVDLLLPPKKTE